MNTTATTSASSKSDTEKYLDAFQNLFLLPRAIVDTGSNRGTYRNHLLRKAKECHQMDEGFWTDASLAMVHARIATSELCEGIAIFNNIAELGHWAADELDGELSEANVDFAEIISAWIHQAPHTDHLEKVCTAAAQTNPPQGNCRSTTNGERTWITCADGIERQAPCHKCPMTEPLRKYSYHAEDLKERFKPPRRSSPTFISRRDPEAGEGAAPPIGPRPNRRQRHRQTGRSHRQHRPSPPRPLGPGRHQRRASHTAPFEPTPQGAP